MTKQLLMSSSYWVLNKTIVKLLGIETAFLLSNMVEAENSMADKEGWFYQTIDTVESMTGLSRHSQTKAIKQLIELKVVEQANRGIPMKRYFKINYKNLNKLLCENITDKNVKNSHTSMKESSKVDCEKSAGNKEHNINNIYKESNDKELLQEKTESSRNGPEIDKNLSLIAKEYEQCGFGTIDFKTKELLEDLSEQYSTEWIVQAFSVCVEANKRTIKYAKGILNNWKTEGGMKLGGKEDGRSSQSNRESEEEVDCEGDRLYKRAVEKFKPRPIEDHEIDF